MRVLPEGLHYTFSPPTPLLPIVLSSKDSSAVNIDAGIIYCRYRHTLGTVDVGKLVK